MFDPATLAEPIVQAPLAGGPSTPELAIAVCEAGGLGFIAAGYKTPDALREQIEAAQTRTDRPFGVNIFVPTPEPADPEALAPYLSRLEPEAGRQGAEVGEPRFEDDHFDAKLKAVCDTRPAVVSFTFGCPATQVFSELHEHDIAAWVTVTSGAEAATALAAGADGLVLQGTEAGGHRGAFVDNEDAGGIGLLALLQLVRPTTSLPLIASGGIAQGAAVAAVLCAGAAAAQIGTALMLTPEAGTEQAQREILNEPIPTRLTRAFSGRLARGMVNRFMLEHSDSAPIAYPEIHHATSPLRAAARRNGDAHSFNLWAGQAHELAQARPAGEIVRELGADARRTIHELAQRLDQTGR
ncbi:MAG TPA: nitronate monooxygenase [Solirubrobacteraceae bacterium]|nr:nitronate monooxygenase [Solirubrobacteraceae bacterium]